MVDVLLLVMGYASRKITCGVLCCDVLELVADFLNFSNFHGCDKNSSI